MKHRVPVGPEADKPAYTFFARTTGDTRKMLIEAHRQITKRLGAAPSNTLLLHELLKAYADPTSK